MGDRPRMVDRLRSANPAPHPPKSNFTWIIGFVTVVAIGIFLYVIYRPSLVGSIGFKGPFSLLAPSNKRTEIFSAGGNNKTLMISDMDEALQFFVYLDGNLRMGQAVQTANGQPSPTSGTYDPCKCNTATDCTNCAHGGYQTVINIQDTFVLEILNTPDASRQNSVSAQIYVKTQNNTTYNIETFPLPPLPEQKWTMITISKQGRQINVYYNSTLVLAKKALNNFSTTTPSCPSAISCGSNSLSGSIGLVSYFPSHQTIQDVSARYQNQTDTRGNLNTLNVVPTETSYRIESSGDFSFIKTLCLDLSCFNMGSTSQKPPNIPPIYNSLETQYA